jgi:hypothetical protein
VAPRSQRNFRTVADPALLVPPLCLRPALTGDTLPPGAEPFTPKLRVPTTRIDFPPSCVGDRAYQVPLPPSCRSAHPVRSRTPGRRGPRLARNAPGRTAPGKKWPRPVGDMGSRLS